MPKIIKIILVCLLVANALGYSYPVCHNNSPIFGSTNDWTMNNGDVSVFVDLTFLGLTKTPSVSTFLTCNGYGVVVTGANSLYNLKPTGFRVYIRFTSGSGTVTP